MVIAEHLPMSPCCVSTAMSSKRTRSEKIITDSTDTPTKRYRPDIAVKHDPVEQVEFEIASKNF